MIGRLRGTLVEKHPPWLLLDVGGVGYELEAPMTTFYDLPAMGETVTLYTYLMVRDDAHLLYGFARRRERDLFRRLIRINGVGGRIALALLSGMSAEELAAAVRDDDIARLTRLPGIGKKTAERLVVELRDRIEVGGDEVPAVAVAGTAPADPLADARQALAALGYKAAEVERLLAAVDAAGRSTEEIIRLALQGAVR